MSHERCNKNIGNIDNHDAASNKCHDSTLGTVYLVAKRVGKPRTLAVVSAPPASLQALTEGHSHCFSPWAFTARVNASPAHEDHAEISGN